MNGHCKAARTRGWITLIGLTAVACGTPPALTPHFAAVPQPVATGVLIPCPDDEDTASKQRPDECFSLPVEIHGRRFRFLADHGAESTVLTESTVTAIGLRHRYANATRADTLVAHGGVTPPIDSSADEIVQRGDTTVEYWGDIEPAVLDSLRVGRSLQVGLMIPREAARGTIGPFDGILGLEVLSQFDLEVDMPGRMLRLYPRVATRATAGPRWLPRRFNRTDCVPAPVVRHAMIRDSTLLDSAVLIDSVRAHDVRWVPAMEHLWNEEKLKLPIVADGHSIAAEFDTGSNETVMNWAAARLLGLDRANPDVRPFGSGRLMAFSNSLGTPAGADSTNYHVTGVTLRLGRQTLPADTLIISDMAFVDFAHFLTEPLMLVGLHQVRDDLLFLSYSSREVCMTSRAPR